MLENQSNFSTATLEAVLATAARLLVRGKKVTGASILANAKAKLEYHQHDNWNGGQDYWRLILALPAEVYCDMDDKEGVQSEIDLALAEAMRAVSTSDFVTATITTALDEDPDWRSKVRMQLSGEGISNQGRVRSDNIAAREHDGLLFRSMPEIHFYNALKRSGVPFAPLSVVLQGGAQYSSALTKSAAVFSATRC